jgi:hypothetical protein
VVSGQFSGGTIAVCNPGDHCTNQVYTVDGSLRNVPVTGTVHFTRHPDSPPKVGPGPVLAVCATVGGTVTLA